MSEKRLGIEYDTNYTPDGDVFVKTDLVGCYLDEVLADARAELLEAAGRTILKRKLLEDIRISLFDYDDPNMWKDISMEAFGALVKKKSADIIAIISAEDAHDYIAIEIERKSTDDEFLINNFSVSYQSWDSLMDYLAECGLISKRKAKSLHI